MSDIITNSENYTNIANSIRNKLNVITQYKPSQMPNAIDSIQNIDLNAVLLKSLTINESVSGVEINLEEFDLSQYCALALTYEITASTKTFLYFCVNSKTSNIWDSINNSRDIFKMPFVDKTHKIDAVYILKQSLGALQILNNYSVFVEMKNVKYLFLRPYKPGETFENGWIKCYGILGGIGNVLN